MHGGRLVFVRLVRLLEAPHEGSSGVVLQQRIDEREQVVGFGILRAGHLLQQVEHVR